MLDPEHKDISIDLDTYHAIMKEWIDDCRNQGYGDVLVCPCLEQRYVKMYNCAFLVLCLSLIDRAGTKNVGNILHRTKKKKRKRKTRNLVIVQLLLIWSGLGQLTGSGGFSKQLYAVCLL